MQVRFESKEYEKTRGKLCRTDAGAAFFAPIFDAMEDTLGTVRGTSPDMNCYSAPSDLRITDVRAVTIAANFDYPIIRIDTNQDIHGYGEVFAGGVKGAALMLKAHLLGANPLDISGILRRIRLSAGQHFWNTGYGAIDLALHDIAGKAYGVPVWKLLGEKLRDRVLLYCDTAPSSDPKQYQKRVLRRKDLGFRFFKMDLYTSLVKHIPGAVTDRGVATEEGLGYMGELIAAVREVVGWKTPLCADHFGPLNVDDAIRYANAFEKYDMAWCEDWIPRCWLNWRGFKTIRERTNVPVLTGEQGFGLEECFDNLISNYALDIIHPDYVASGGILEIKRIADFAAAHGIPAAIHMPGSPIGQAAMTHLAAVLPNFVCVEHHAADMPWWQDLVTGLSKPIIDDGYMFVPDTPGLGLELNEEVIKDHLRYPGYLEPTPMYDDYIACGWLAAP